MTKEISTLNSVFHVEDVDIESTLDVDVSLDRLRINDEFEDHARLFGWYATAYELAADRERRLKVDLERCYANLDPLARQHLEDAGVRPSEKKVENIIITNSTYVEIQDDLLDAQKQTGLLKAAKEAMVVKKDALVTLGANLRAEAASNPSILQNNYLKTKQTK